MSVSLVARQEGVGASLLFQWREPETEGTLVMVSAGESVVPASALAAARAEIAKLQRMRERRPLRTRSSRKRWSTPPTTVDFALAVVDTHSLTAGAVRVSRVGHPSGGQRVLAGMPIQ